MIADLKKAAEGEAEKEGAEAKKAEPMPDVTVVPVDGGVMIQLTDKIDYGMFTIGSAKAGCPRGADAGAYSAGDFPPAG